MDSNKTDFPSNHTREAKAVKAGVQKSWSLLEFARLHGKMKVAPFVNKETGETFKSCVFVDDNNNITLVAFSSKLGELTPKEIAEQKKDLYVVLLSSGTYKLCRVTKERTNESALTFSKISEHGSITCNDCGAKMEHVAAFTHSFMDAWIGRQCPNCGHFCEEHNVSKEYHVLGDATEDFLCPQCGYLIRKKEESIFKGNNVPLFCPHCKSKNLSYHCEYLT